MLGVLRRFNFHRKMMARKAPDGALRAFYETPYSRGGTDYRDIEYVALDLETTGLSPRDHEIVSFGWVVIRGQHIDHRTAGHQIVKLMSNMTADSAVVHGIMDDHVAVAPPLVDGLERILPVLAGRVLVAHHAPIEKGFISAACQRIFGVKFDIPTVDTLLVERRIMERKNQHPGRGNLHLDAARQRYNLPRYRAHNAMIDAIAAGELFLAQAAHRSAGKPFALRDLLT